MTSAGPTKILYISYDGILEPLGESQVLCYIERLAPEREITLLSYEKPHSLRDKRRHKELKRRLQQASIKWVHLRYHSWPTGVATAYDIARGIVYSVIWYCSTKGHMIHARSYVASLIALSCKKILPVKFIFDMRGFWPDERVDGGYWQQTSAFYKLAKCCERFLFESADAIISLTHAGVRAFPRLGYEFSPPVAPVVIPTCTNMQRFYPGPKGPALQKQLSLGDHFVIGCSGTMNGWYLRKEMLAFLSYLNENIKDSRLLVISQESHEELRHDAEEAGISPDRLTVARATFEEMPQLMRLMDVGVFFIKKCFSKQASCATKLGEFLATGVPVIINDGIGDTDDIVSEHNVGIVLSGFQRMDFGMALEKLNQFRNDPDVQRRCRQTAEQYFDLDTGVQNYANVYRRLKH